MKITQARHKAAIIIALIMLISTCAAAGTISYTTSTPIPYSKTDWVGTLALQKFDPSIGILKQVDLTCTSGIITTLTITNNAASSSSGNARTEVIVTLTDPLSLLSLEVDIITSPFVYSLPPGGTATSGLLSKSGSDSGSWTNNAILEEFKGTGNILLNVSTFTQTLLANTGGNTAADQSTTASASATVTYYYDEIVVPEPSGIVALFSGVVGICGVAFRRRK